jgi:hypothetical protein
MCYGDVERAKSLLLKRVEPRMNIYEKPPLGHNV